MKEVQKALKENKLIEVFGAGTVSCSSNGIYYSENSHV